MKRVTVLPIMFSLALASRRPLDSTDDAVSLLQTSVMVEANVEVLLPLPSSNSSEAGKTVGPSDHGTPHHRASADEAVGSSPNESAYESPSLLQQSNRAAKEKANSPPDFVVLSIGVLMPVAAAVAIYICWQRSKIKHSDFKAAAEQSLIPGSHVSASPGSPGSQSSFSRLPGIFSSNDKLSSSHYDRYQRRLVPGGSEKRLPGDLTAVSGIYFDGEVTTGIQNKFNLKFTAEANSELVGLAHFREGEEGHGILIELPPENKVIFLDTGPIHDDKKAHVVVLPIGKDGILDPLADPLALIMPAANKQGFVVEVDGRTHLVAKGSNGQIREIVDNSGANVAMVEKGKNGGRVRLVIRQNAEAGLRNLILAFIIGALKLGASITPLP
jgi:hypothetical protein